MNPTFPLFLTRRPLALALAGLTYAAGVEMLSAVESTTAAGGAPQAIQLPASNSAVSSVTVWKSSRTARNRRAMASPKDWTPRVIQLHAPNSPTPSITIWSPK